MNYYLGFVHSMSVPNSQSLLFNMRLQVYALVTITLAQLTDSTTVCSKKTTVGKDKSMAMTDHLDKGNGMLFIMHDSAYILPCCGFIEQWQIYIQHAGFIQLQVWRSLGNGSYTLVGENRAYYFDGEENGAYELPVDVDEQIATRSGDLVGWYTEAESMVPYVKERKGHGASVTKIHSIARVGENLDLSDAQLTEPRGYAIDLVLRKPNQLKFGNLNNDILLEHDLLPGSDIFTVLVDGWHSESSSPLYEVRLDTLDDYFGFNISSGRVFIQSTPPAAKYSLSFTLSDHCGSTSTGTLKITVHVKFPQIDNLPDQVTLREDNQNKEVLVKELSVLSQGRLSCKVLKINPSEGKRVFVMRNVNGVFTVFLKATAILNYAEQDSYELTIHCSEGKAVDSEQLVVNIEPNAVPQFTNLPASILIHADDDVIGGIVYYISAQDEENNVMSFNMSCDPQHCPFDISRGGEIFVIEDIRSVHSNIYYLEIHVADMFNTGMPELLVVNISGINKPPFITNLPSDPIVLETLHENVLPGTFIYMVSVVDQDANDSVHFVMKTHPANMNQYFSLNETTGMVTAGAPVDYESSKIKNVKLEIISSDGKDSAKGYFRVSIVDMNEPPVFTHDIYTIFTDEGRPGAKTKSSMKAKDNDKNDAVTYSIYCGNETDYVTIDEKSADITQTYGFDVDQYGTPEHVIYCNVTATDTKGLYASVPVNIVISDSDDNGPAFEQTSYLFVATRDLPVFSILGQARAFDIDTTPENSKLVYYLEDTTDDFIIDENGTVYLIKDMSHVGFGTLFKFTVKSEDSDRKSDIASVTVVVLPGNYTTVTSVFVAKTKSFLELPENIAWLITALYLLLILVGLSIYVSARSFECVVRRRRGSFVTAKPIAGRKPNSTISTMSIEATTLSRNALMSSGKMSRTWDREFCSSPIPSGPRLSIHEIQQGSAIMDFKGDGRAMSRSSILSGTPSDCKHNRSILQGTPSDCQHNRSMLSGTPSNCQHNRSMSSGTPSECQHNRSMLSLSGIVPSTTESKVNNWKPWAISDFKRDKKCPSIQDSGRVGVNNGSSARVSDSSRRASAVSAKHSVTHTVLSENTVKSSTHTASKNMDF